MTPLSIKAAGMVTCVGFNAESSCAAMRAGIRNVVETNLWDKYSGTYLPAGRVALPHWWVGVGKLADLVAPAIEECFAAAGPVQAAAIPVMLGVAPPNRPYRFRGLDETILSEIGHKFGFRLHPDSRLISNDHISVVIALREAIDLLASGKAPCVVIAAVDSLVDQRIVEYYLEKRRLLTPLETNGFCVGEAGAAVLVAPANQDGKGGLTIRGVGLGSEPANIDGEEPVKGEGLTEVVRHALRRGGLTIQDIHYRITDLNGEHYKFKEMVLAMGRFARKPTAKVFDIWHPIEYIGDVGAAIGPLLLGVALHAGKNGYGNGPNVLCTLANDDGARAAIVTSYEA